MKTSTTFFLIAGMIYISASCDTKNDTNEVIGNIDLYLIKSFDTIENSFRIDESTVKYEDNALIMYDQIISYNQTNYTFTITENAQEIITNLNHFTHGLAFAIVANKELIYTGYFWPSVSSMTCDWIVADPLTVDMKAEMQIKLGYPCCSDNMNIPDNRNDRRIIDILNRDKKLKE